MASEDKCQIVRFFHCRMCAAEMPPGVSPQEYQRIQAGFTRDGIQVWCTRHNVTVVHLKERK